MAGAESSHRVMQSSLHWVIEIRNGSPRTGVRDACSPSMPLVNDAQTEFACSRTTTPPGDEERSGVVARRWKGAPVGKWMRDGWGPGTGGG